DLVRESAEEAEDDDEEETDEAEETEEPTNGAKANGVKSNGRRPRKQAAPPIQDALKRGQEIMVQVSKEPISTKGPRVTAQISLAGRFLVYIPDSSRVGVSRKISGGAERQRLKEQVGAILPDKAGGVIVRTVSEDVTPEALRRDLEMLMAQWKKIQRKSKFTRAPAQLHRETGLTRGLVRDLFSAKVDSLTIDSKPVFNEVVEYLKTVAPDLIDRVKLYEKHTPLFDTAGIEAEIRDAFKRRCDLPSG